MSVTTPMSHRNAPLAYVSHGDRQYSTVFVPECRTCRSSHRAEIEEMLIDGLPPKTIIERLPDDCAVSPQSVKRHFARGHLPIDTEMVRQRQQIRAEQRWEELGLAATAFMAREADLAQYVIDNFTRLLHDGKLTLSAATLMRAASFIYDIEIAARQQEDDGRLAERLVQQSIDELQCVFQLAGEVGGEEVRNELVRRACADAVTEIIMVDDRFAKLRGAAYLDADTSNERNQPHFFQLSRSDLGNHQQVNDTIKVAA